MKVFVTGGTGAIGRYVVPALVGSGHEVTTLVRSPDKAAAVAAQGATPIPVSLFNRDALAAALPGHDALINMATALPRHPASCPTALGAQSNTCASTDRPHSWTPHSPPVYRA